MWKNENVERALFKWNKWRSSIIGYWSVEMDNFTTLSLNTIRKKTNNVLSELGFPVCVLFELYWISCILSDYVIDDRNTYKNIVLSCWLASLYAEVLSKVCYKISSGDRVYPPKIWNEKDVVFQGGKIFGGEPPKVILESLRSPNDKEQWIYLPPKHELHKLLNTMKGRPPARRKPGKYAIYSDRLAVKCAVLKDIDGKTFVEIAEQLGLKISQPYISRQSDLARHLVARGRNLLINVDTC
jgi:hypothetical protein